MSLKDFLGSKGVQKKPKLTKEELEQQKYHIELMKTVIFPIILENSTSIKDAQNICRNLIVGMDGTFHADVQKYIKARNEDKLSTFDLKNAMNPGQENTAEWKLVEALQNEKVSIIKSLLDGLDKQIEGLTNKELTERKLETLQIDFL